MISFRLQLHSCRESIEKHLQLKAYFLMMKLDTEFRFDAKMKPYVENKSLRMTLNKIKSKRKRKSLSHYGYFSSLRTEKHFMGI